MLHLESEYGSGQPDLKEALIRQLNNELDALSYPASPTPIQLEKFINTLDALPDQLLNLGDNQVADRRLGLRIAAKFPDDKSKEEVIRRDMSWTDIKHSLRVRRGLRGT
jgi:hypothetical protein